MTTAKQNDPNPGDSNVAPGEPFEEPAVEVLPPEPDDAAAMETFTPDPESFEIVNPPDVFRRMELEDERAVMEELQGRALDVMLYDFPGEGGKRNIGFGVVGVHEAVGTLNRRGYTRIRVSPEFEPRFTEIDLHGEPAIRCTVYAEDLGHGSGQWGTAEQPKKMTLKGGGKKPDPFCYRKALSKAQRNALEPLVPLELREYLKAQYVGAGRVKVIPGADEPVAERPVPLDDEQAQAQIQRLTDLYDEIKAIDRLVMPPGQFNAIVQGAQHSHERLDHAIAHLAEFLAGEQEIGKLKKAAFDSMDANEFDKELVKMAGLSQQRRRAKLTELIEANS